MGQRIIANRAKCLKCDDIIESKHIHDLIYCSCKNIFTDGGNQYIRYGGPGLMDNSYVDMSESEGTNSSNSKPE